MMAHLDVSFPTVTGDIAVNPKTNRVYIVGPEVVYVLDGATNTRIIATINIPEGINTFGGSISVNPATNMVYATLENIPPQTTTVMDG